MNGPVLILGKDGQVGRALCRLLGDKAMGAGRAEADLSKPESLPELLDRIVPSAVINAAAYTQVDRAETEEALAHTVNAKSVGILAKWCAEKNIPFLHYSTDYVFDGSGTHARKESEQAAPLNAYGRSKLAGERAVKAAGGKYLIFRTSWVYDAWGKNFYTTMLRLGAECEELRIVADQIGAPTYAPHLAAASWQALRHATESASFPSGIYHLCHSRETSWHGFAAKIFEGEKARGTPLKLQRLFPIPSTDYPTPAPRPANSRLDCAKAWDILGLRLASWEAGLTDCITARHADS